MTDQTPQTKAEPVNAAHAAYGALWCMVTDNPVIHAARKHLLESIGGARSDGQREAIKWAGRNVVPPSDAEIAAIDATPQPLVVGLDRAVERLTRVVDGKDTWKVYADEGFAHPDETFFGDLRAILALAAPAEGWQGIETAPKDGTVIIAMGRYCGATAGFPCFVAYMHGAWRELGRTVMEPMVCWAWKPREILGAWPAEPAAPTGGNT